MMNGNGTRTQQAKQVYDGRTEVSVTLPVNTWNNILTVVADAPWKIADPLMMEICLDTTATLEPVARSARCCSGWSKAGMTEVQNFPGGLPTDYRVHLEWVRYNSDLGISTIDNFDLAFVPVG